MFSWRPDCEHRDSQLARPSLDRKHSSFCLQRLFTYLQLQDSSEVKREGDCERSRCDTIV